MMSKEYSTKEKTDMLTEHINGEKVKGKLQQLITRYNQEKEDINACADLQDEFNQLSFYLSELVAKSKDIYNHAQLEAKNAFNKKYLELRGEINPDTSRPFSGDDARMKAQLLISDYYFTEYAAEICYVLIRGFSDDCLGFRNSCQQRVSTYKQEHFSARQQV